MATLKHLGFVLVSWSALLSMIASAIVGFFSFLLAFSWYDSRMRLLLLAAFCCVVFFASRKLLNIFKRKFEVQCHDFITSINEKYNLSLDTKIDNVLGYTAGGAYVAFDTKNRKLAIRRNAKAEIEIKDFSYILGWRYEWNTGQKINNHITFGGGNVVPGTNMMTPGSTQTVTEYKNNFTVILEVADMTCPLMKFSVFNEDIAKEWCAKLNAAFNS